MPVVIMTTWVDLVMPPTKMAMHDGKLFGNWYDANDCLMCSACLTEYTREQFEANQFPPKCACDYWWPYTITGAVYE